MDAPLIIAQSSAPSRAFGVLDWSALALYFVILIAASAWYSRRKSTTTADYFLAARSMPVWAVAVSILATALSAATFLGVPELSYTGDLTYLSTNLGGLLAIVLVALCFIPVFYRHNVTSIYELLGTRFGLPAQRAASLTFMVGRTLATGARLYMAAIPMALIIFGDDSPAHLAIGVGVLSLVGIIYTLIGGIRTVIWTDVIQTAIFLLAIAGVIALLLWRIPASPGEIVHALAHPPAPPDNPSAVVPSKLRLFNLSADTGQAFSLPAVLIGFTLIGLGSYGTDHEITQKMLTCKSAIRGGWSAFLGILVGVPAVALFLLTGLLLNIYYTRPDVMGTAAPGYAPQAGSRSLLTFILREMPPGMSGVMIAGLFAAALSSLNAMSSTLIADFYRPLVKARSEQHYLRAGRVAVVVWGIILGGVACLCIAWHQASKQSLIDFALSVMTFAYAGLIAAFLTAIFTKRGSNTSVIAALIVGFLIVVMFQPWSWGPFWGWFTELNPAWTATPGIDDGFRLGEVRLAYPWHLTIGVVVAIGVCVLGKRGCHQSAASLGRATGAVVQASPVFTEAPVAPQSGRTGGTHP